MTSDAVNVTVYNNIFLK